MDVREDGDAHPQSLAARSAGIGAAPRVLRCPRRVAKVGRVSLSSADVRRRTVRDFLWAPLMESDPVFTDDSVFTGTEGRAEILTMTLPTADLKSVNRYGGTALIPAAHHGHPDAVRVLLASSGNASSTSSGSGATVGNNRRPALALTRVGGDVLDADRRDLGRSRRGRSPPRPSRGTTPFSGSTRRAAPALPATRPRAGSRGSRRRCRRRRTPGPRAGEAPGSPRGCRGRAAGRARAGRARRSG
jgi:hypothetical protein